MTHIELHCTAYYYNTSTSTRSLGPSFSFWPTAAKYMTSGNNRHITKVIY